MNGGAAPDSRGPRASASLLSGASVMFGGRLVGAVLSYGGTVLIARELSLADFGTFSLIFNLLGLLGLISDFETSRIVISELSETDDIESIAGRFVVFRIALGAVVYALALAIVIIGPYTHTEVLGVALAGLSLFISTALWAVISVCQAKLWLRAVAIAMVVGQIVQFAFVLALHSTGHGTTLRYVAVYLISDAVALVWLVVALRDVVRIRPRIHPASWRRWLRAAAPLAIGSALGTLYFRLDSIMLAWLGPALNRRRAVAVYQVGYKFSDLLAFVAPALIAAVLPLLARAWPDHADDFRRIWRQSLLLVTVIAGFATATFAALAPRVIPLLFTAKYTIATGPARLLVAGQALNFFTQLIYVGLVATGRRKRFPIAMFVGLAVNVSVNLVLIPRHGVMGAAIATVLTEVIVIGALVRGLRGLPVRPLPIRAFVVISVSTTAAALVIVYGMHIVPWPIAGVAGSAVFALLLHVLAIDGPGGLPAFVRAARVDVT
jgi:O-antigen/teichoic acid export membrane protein